MKTVLIMRHAKSDWSEADDIPDFDRGLNERGQRDAPHMGKWLLKEKAIPNVIISSPAQRARLTVDALTQACGYTGEVIWLEALYPGEIGEVLEILKGLSDNHKSAMVVGHNPFIEDFLAFLSGEHHRMSTSAIACVQANILKWSDLWPDACEISWVTSPKEMKGKD